MNLRIKKLKFQLQKEAIKTNLSIDIIIVCILDAFATYERCLLFIRLAVVLCALYELNYYLKAVSVAIVIKFNNCSVLVSSRFR